MGDKERRCFGGENEECFDFGCMAFLMLQIHPRGR
jgi:hypothetical protein